jgi:hypothetical protein
MSDDAAPPRELFIARLVIGLIQGLVLYLLYRASDGFHWPANDPYLFAPLVLIALYVPLLVTQAAGSMRLQTLIAWALVATALCAGLAFYDRFRTALIVITNPNDILPNFSTFFFGFAALFIAQSLVAAGDRDRRVMATYDSYFDAAWKLGVQFALATVFVGVFWGVLWLGAMLFNLIKLDFIEKLIEHDWFAIPATTLATAAALHLTDVRARLVAGIRNVVLTMLAWLLPLLTIIAVGFLVSLFATGLQPLWQTREAASGLLVACAALVVLINAAYQNGEDAQPAALRYSEMAASVALVPLVALSIYAVSLRVAQYGWTVDRIASAACLFIATCYALGYAAAALFSLRGGVWMEFVQRCNIVTAFLAIAVVLALFSPIADPSRISVNDQVARLQAGKISPAKFDFYYLHTEGGRFGDAALKMLAKSANPDIRKDAQYQIDVHKPSPPAPRNYNMASNLKVYPKGAALPPEFFKQNWATVKSDFSVPACLTVAQEPCDAILADLDNDGTNEVIIVSGTDASWWGTIIKKNPAGIWTPIAYMPTPHCAGDVTALESGNYKLVTPPPPAMRAISIGGHFVLVKLADSATEPVCSH